MMIELRGVGFHYPRQPLLFDGFDWQVQTGERWAILGPSGCGKSTLLYLLAALRLPCSGKVLIDGRAWAKPRPATGLILQDYGLLPWASVRDNITLGLRIRRFYGPDGVHAPLNEPVSEIEAQAHTWLERVGLRETAQQFPAQLSGGQRQRVAIARTLALNPDLLLMDEPFASLDTSTRAALREFVLHLAVERGMTMIIVTHSVEEAAMLGRKILVLARPPHQRARLFDNPAADAASISSATANPEICNLLRCELEAAV